MDRQKQTYHEELLHWIWETRNITPPIKTVDDQTITIHQPGTINKSDGPDFQNAEITIGSLRWFGDVEIHWTVKDWNAHGHQGDSNFDQVILHVVFEETDQTIKRANGSEIPTLSLKPYIKESLQSFLEQYLRAPKLPCSGHFSFISEKAFSKQLELAHKEYFEQKVDDLLEFYDPHLPPSVAWQKMFVVALFDGLGISHNRNPMLRLAQELFSKAKKAPSVEWLINKALDMSGLNSDTSTNSFQWKHRGSRPGNHPHHRIRQGAACLWYIRQRPFKDWMSQDPKTLWAKMLQSIPVTPSIGRERADILFGTVYLPALYSLGNLFYSEKLKSISWELWQDHRVSLPPSLLRLFKDTPLPPSLYAHKLGTIRQLRNYCKPKNCKNCEVFKSAISS